MKKYLVDMSVTVMKKVLVEADDEDHAKELAVEEAEFDYGANYIYSFDFESVKEQ